MEYTKYPFLLQSGAPLFTFSASFFRGGEGVPHTLRQPFVNLMFHTVFRGRKKIKKTVGAFFRSVSGVEEVLPKLLPNHRQSDLPAGRKRQTEFGQGGFEPFSGAFRFLSRE